MGAGKWMQKSQLAPQCIILLGRRGRPTGGNLVPKSKVEEEMLELIARHGLEPFLQFTRLLVALMDSSGDVIASNPAFESLGAAIPNAKTISDYMHPAVWRDFDKMLRAASRDRAVARGRLELEASGRRLYDALLVPLEDGRLLLFAEPSATGTDVPEKYRGLAADLEQVRAELEDSRVALEIKQTELRAVIAQADEVAHTDALTFLPNRKLILADLQRQVTYAERYGTPLAISMIDLDHFKFVNDNYGHSAGDEVLRLIAMALHDVVRQADEVGRYGGEEFLVLLPSSNISAASEQAGRLCQHIRSTPIFSGRHEIHMTVSIGIAQYRLHQENWQALLNRADQALYQAKGRGRDQWAVIEV